MLDCSRLSVSVHKQSQTLHHNDLVRAFHKAVDTGKADEDTYGANVFAFIKPGGMSGNIPMTDVRRSVVSVAGSSLCLCFGPGRQSAR